MPLRSDHYNFDCDVFEFVWVGLTERVSGGGGGGAIKGALVPTKRKDCEFGSPCRLKTCTFKPTRNIFPWWSFTGLPWKAWNSISRSMRPESAMRGTGTWSFADICPTCHGLNTPQQHSWYRNVVETPFGPSSPTPSLHLELPVYKQSRIWPWSLQSTHSWAPGSYQGYGGCHLLSHQANWGWNFREGELLIILSHYSITISRFSQFILVINPRNHLSLGHPWLST